MQVKTGKRPPYKSGPNSGWSPKFYSYKGNGLTVEAVQDLNSETFSVVYASTLIIGNTAEVTAKRVAERVINSGAENIKEMRDAAREFLDGLA